MFETQFADTYFCARVSSLIADKNSVMQLREEHGVAYHRSFPGCQLIDWLLQNGEVESRRQGIDLCRALQEHGIVQHGEGCPPLLFGRTAATSPLYSRLTLLCAHTRTPATSCKEARLLRQRAALPVLHQLPAAPPAVRAAERRRAGQQRRRLSVRTGGQPSRQPVYAAEEPTSAGQQRFSLGYLEKNSILFFCLVTSINPFALHIKWVVF